MNTRKGENMNVQSQPGGSLVSALFIGGGGVLGIVLALYFSWGILGGILCYLAGSFVGWALLAILFRKVK